MDLQIVNEAMISICGGKGGMEAFKTRDTGRRNKGEMKGARGGRSEMDTGNIQYLHDSQGQLESQLPSTMQTLSDRLDYRHITR
jgi:hypothetical protein